MMDNATTIKNYMTSKMISSMIHQIYLTYASLPYCWSNDKATLEGVSK